MKRLFLLLLVSFFPSIALADYVQCHKWPSPGSSLKQMGQIWNPSNSGKTLNISRITIHSNSSTSWNIIATDTQFPELRNQGHSTHINSSGTAVAKGELRGATNANQGAYQVYSLYVLSGQGNQQVTFDLNVKVDPGWGLAVVSRDEGMTLAACFDWTEE